MNAIKQKEHGALFCERWIQHGPLKFKFKLRVKVKTIFLVYTYLRVYQLHLSL